MSVIFVLIAVCFFVLADFFIRMYLEKKDLKKKKIERAKALETNLNLDFSHEAKSLKRVEVDNPVAKILAVDDEEIILDSFRKILVLEGYSIDTVESGKEALSLVQKRDYDFVFTDLKMPEMDGVDVCKSVKHLRPDIDVIIITGYASIDTAVETMKFGAMDYIQKPFTEDELTSMVKKFQIRREERISKVLKPKVNITHKDEGIRGKVEFQIPGGVFISKGHCWSKIRTSGILEVGIDDFAKKIIGTIKKINVPDVGNFLQKGGLLFTIIQGEHSIPFYSPVSGEVTSVNSLLIDELDLLEHSAYGKNFICTIKADHLDEDLKDLYIGQSAVELFNGDISRLNEYVKKHVRTTKDEDRIPADGLLYIGELELLQEENFRSIVSDFFIP